jgi:hypothetical protein
LSSSCLKKPTPNLPDLQNSNLENEACPHFEVKQAFFKTRRGRIYRVLFVIDGNDV